MSLGEATVDHDTDLFVLVRDPVSTSTLWANHLTSLRMLRCHLGSTGNGAQGCGRHTERTHTPKAVWSTKRTCQSGNIVDASLEQFALLSKNKKKRLLRKIYENSSFNSYNFHKNSGSVSL